MGIELYNNVKQAWWRWMVYERDDIEGLDSSIILTRAVWKYSGHEDTFSDPLVDCRECKQRFRADKVWEEYVQSRKKETGLTLLPIMRKKMFSEGKIPCPNCGNSNWTDIRNFNLMFRTTIGAAAEEDDPTALAYLRPETGQGICINFLK